MSINSNIYFEFQWIWLYYVNIIWIILKETWTMQSFLHTVRTYIYMICVQIKTISVITLHAAIRASIHNKILLNSNTIVRSFQIETFTLCIFSMSPTMSSPLDLTFSFVMSSQTLQPTRALSNYHSSSNELQRKLSNSQTPTRINTIYDFPLWSYKEGT